MLKRMELAVLVKNEIMTHTIYIERFSILFHFVSCIDKNTVVDSARSFFDNASCLYGLSGSFLSACVMSSTVRF